MDANEVRARVAEIRACAGDDEMAHGMEDKLHFDVLVAIANGACIDPAACARAAITTVDLDFSRWCA